MRSIASVENSNFIAYIYEVQNCIHASILQINYEFVSTFTSHNYIKTLAQVDVIVTSPSPYFLRALATESLVVSSAKPSLLGRLQIFAKAIIKPLQIDNIISFPSFNITRTFMIDNIISPACFPGSTTRLYIHKPIY